MKTTLRITAQPATPSKPFDDRLIFINAWNEWAEGNHLEPDLRAAGKMKLARVQSSITAPRIAAKPPAARNTSTFTSMHPPAAAAELSAHAWRPIGAS